MVMSGSSVQKENRENKEKNREESKKGSKKGISKSSPKKDSVKDSLNAGDSVSVEEFMLIKQQNDENLSKIKEFEETIKRQQAEFENYRKRTLKEKEDLTKEAGEKILKDILDVYDNFERALSVEIDEKNQSVIEGFKMIGDQIDALLLNHHVSEIDGIGHPFDPNLHQAIQFEEKEDEQKETIGEVYQKGFRLGDKVLRHAKVKVLKPTAQTSDIEKQEEETSN